MPKSRIWHPFADMRVVAQNEVVLERGEGVWIWDDSGRRYLDAAAGLWFCSVGWGRDELAAAAAEQLSRLATYSSFGVLTTQPLRDLAARVSELAPLDDAVVFFTTGGSDAVDSAAKLARRYWTAKGENRSLFVLRDGAYHGMNGLGTSLAGIEVNRTGYGELVKEVVIVPRDDPSAFAELASSRGGEIAAFFGEPVIGAGGVFPPSDGYWSRIREICDQSGALLVFDEVITGFGRLGEWFAADRYGVKPDLITVAKGITSGYMPLGAVICGQRVSEPFWSGEAGPFRHGYTYSGHTSACAVALANLDILERERLVDRVAQLEPTFAKKLRSLEKHPLVREVRTVGLLAGVELEPDGLLDRPGLVDTVVELAREHGILTRGLLGHSLQVSPPFIINEAEVGMLVDALWAAIDSAMV